MSLFLKSGNTYRVSSKEEMDLHELLPVGTYTLKYNQLTSQYYLELVDSFTSPGKVYGDYTSKSQRIIRTFLDRPASTGVLLVGEKGSGKTLLSKMISIEGAGVNIPTIVINQPFTGDGFNSFIQSIEQPTIIIFDEFEKVYDNDSQEQILTLLDGVYPSKKLFLITSNDKYRVNYHMRNRPGRIYYFLEFHGLDAEFVREYCRDNLQQRDQTEDICKFSSLFAEFNFDMLKAIVEEINRYGGTVRDVVEMINAKPDNAGDSTYQVTLTVDGKNVELDDDTNTWRGNVFTDPVAIQWKKHNEDDFDWTWSKFNSSNIVKVDSERGKFTLKNSLGEVVTLTKEKTQGYRYFDAF